MYVHKICELQYINNNNNNNTFSEISQVKFREGTMYSNLITTS